MLVLLALLHDQEAGRERLALVGERRLEGSHDDGHVLGDGALGEDDRRRRAVDTGGLDGAALGCRDWSLDGIRGVEVGVRDAAGGLVAAAAGRAAGVAAGGDGQDEDGEEER